MNTRNLQMQQHLRTKMEEANAQGFNFTKQGMHYLACRVNGLQYSKPILIGIELLLNNQLATLADNELLSRTLKLFGMKTLPPEAILILATGRRPVFSAKYHGWQEDQSSLLNPKPPQPEALAKVSEAMRNKINANYEHRLAQGKLCEEWLKLLTDQFDDHNPPTILKTPAIPQPPKVVQLKAPKHKVKATPQAPQATLTPTPPPNHTPTNGTPTMPITAHTM